MRALKSHLSTVDYFIKRGWIVSYALHDLDMDRLDEQELYQLYIYRNNHTDSLSYTTACKSLEEVMTTASEWLVDNIQNKGRQEGNQ